MRVRPGRLRSLIAGIAALIVTAVGLFLMPGPGFGGGFSSFMPGLGLFKVLWVTVGLIGAGVAFYNALSKRGVPLYEIDVDDEERDRNREGESYCPNCGQRVSEEDRFCRHCGTPL